MRLLKSVKRDSTEKEFFLLKNIQDCFGDAVEGHFVVRS